MIEIVKSKMFLPYQADIPTLISKVVKKLHIKNDAWSASRTVLRIANTGQKMEVGSSTTYTSWCTQVKRVSSTGGVS